MRGKHESSQNFICLTRNSRNPVRWNPENRCFHRQSIRRAETESTASVLKRIVSPAEKCWTVILQMGMSPIRSTSPQHAFSRALLVPILLGVFGMFAAGCDTPDRFAVRDLNVLRDGWDTLDVSARFTEDRPMAGMSEVVPDLVTVTLFDEAYDTLYAGPLGRFAVFDENLGDEERLLLEVCGYLGTRQSCNQRALSASPKRALADYEVTFPQDSTNGYERAYVESRVLLERQIHGEEGWERFEPTGRKEIFIDTWISGHPDARMRLPVVRRGQRFILPRHAGYRDFRYAIQSSMLDADSAAVNFDLHIRLSRESIPVASQQIVLRAKSESEREDEMRALVERAGGQVLEAMDSFFGVRRAYVFINDWSYTALDRVYKAEFELHWQSGLRGAWSDLTGEMQVRSDGELGTFTLIRASERAGERWEQRIGQTVLELDHLYPENEILPPDDDLESRSDDEDPDPRRRRRQ